MTLAIDRKPMTVEEFMNLPDSQDFELIDGNLVERKKVGARASLIAVQILGEIRAFLKVNPLGWPFGADTVYRCFGPTYTGRRCDASFIRRGRFPGERIPDADIQIAPDLAIEVVSPNDLAYEVNDKVSLYLAAGVAMVWLVYPETRNVEVVRRDKTATLLGPDDEISGESVLPGFKATIADFFPPIVNVETTGEVVS